MISVKKLLVFFAAFIISGTLSALNPSREYAVRPDKYGMDYKEEKITLKDGAVINAWFFETSKKTTNWIVISDDGDGNMADNIEICSQFLSAGWNVAMYDYRGFGASSDFNIDPDTYIYPQFVEDLNGILDYLRKSRAVTKFDLYGQYIGGGLALGVGANRPETRKMIADGPWLELEGMKKKLKEVKQKDVIIPFGYDKNKEPIYGCDKSRANIKGVMIIVSPNDELLTPVDMKPLRCTTYTYVVTESPSNAKNFETDKNAYFEKVNKFLNAQ
ncbi:MAG TPA: alpha/beta hydrolase [Bacteroidia bacterium]|nr:alpha/beta hydrolase [Bacteroidia bacterium]